MSEFQPTEFAAAFSDFLEFVSANAPEKDPKKALLADRVEQFLEADASSLEIVREEPLARDLPNVQVAIDELRDSWGMSYEAVGYQTEHEFGEYGMAEVLNRNAYRPVREGAVRYRNVELDDRELRCVSKGLLFLTTPAGKAIMFMHYVNDYGDPKFSYEIVAEALSTCDSVRKALRQQMRENDVYRGKVVSLGARGLDDIRFHNIEPVSREDIILPTALLETIERNTVTFVRHAERLKSAGRHIKRGLLFHGPPGTGKSMTIRYLMSAMPDRTVVVMSGRELGLIQRSCAFARMLAPATVVLEDVDLIAEDRDSAGAAGCNTPLLFELLNEMDGIDGDADVLFVLSTNRPEILEPALAARPGRIDQAIEFPLPDAECRRRLFQLYAKGLPVADGALEDMVPRTEGTSPAFIRELLRKAALIAADASAEGEGLAALGTYELNAAMREMIVDGGALTRALLGVAPGALESSNV